MNFTYLIFASLVMSGVCTEEEAERAHAKLLLIPIANSVSACVRQVTTALEEVRKEIASKES